MPAGQSTPTSMNLPRKRTVQLLSTRSRCSNRTRLKDMDCKCLSFVFVEIHVFTFNSLLFFACQCVITWFDLIKIWPISGCKISQIFNLRFSKFHSSSDITEIFWFRSHSNLSKICLKSGVSVCLVIFCGLCNRF